MPAENSETTGEGGLRVLIVDDDAANAQTTGWMVELFEFDYRIALTAQDAVAAAEDFRPDVALLDIGMPDMNGFDLCRKLQTVAGCEACVFVAQTGWDNQAYRDRAAEAGFSHYLLKPFTLDELENILRQVRPGDRD